MSSSNSWLGKISGLSPRSKYENRDTSPSPQSRRRSTSSNPTNSGETQNKVVRKSSLLRPRSMSPFSLRRSRSRDNISSDVFTNEELRQSEDGANSFIDNDGVGDDISVTTSTQELADEFVETSSNGVRSDRGVRGDYDGIAHKPLEKISSFKKSPQPLLEGVGQDSAAYSMESPHREQTPLGNQTSGKHREVDDPIRASHAALAIEDTEDEVGLYHYQNKQKSPSSVNGSPQHIDLQSHASLLDVQRMAYDAASPASSPSTPQAKKKYPLQSPSKLKEEAFDLLEHQKRKDSSSHRQNRFTRRGSSGTPPPPPSSSHPPSTSPSKGDSNVPRSKRGSTPRGSSLDGPHNTPTHSPPHNSNYVKHLENELATLRSDRGSLMQTILELKQENEENAQAAARLDDDNGDEMTSLSTRINELDGALQKANTTIKLMRQANQTLKKELEEVKFENHTLRGHLESTKSTAQGHENEGAGAHKAFHARSSQSAAPVRTTSQRTKPPTQTPPPTNQPSDVSTSPRMVLQQFEENVRSPSKSRRSSSSMGRPPTSAPPSEPPPPSLQSPHHHPARRSSHNTKEAAVLSNVKSPPKSPASPPPELPFSSSRTSPSSSSTTSVHGTSVKARSPDKVPPPLPPPRATASNNGSHKKLSRDNHRDEAGGGGDSDARYHHINERRSDIRSSESMLYNHHSSFENGDNEERRSQLRRSDPDGYFFHSSESPSPRSSKIKNPSPVNHRSSPRSRSTSLKQNPTITNLSDVEEQLEENSLEKTNGDSSVEKMASSSSFRTPQRASIGSEQRERSSSRKPVTRPPSPTPVRRSSSGVRKGSPMAAPSTPTQHSSAATSPRPKTSNQSNGTSTPRGSSSTRRSLPRDSGLADLLNYVPTPRLKNGTPRSRSHTPSGSSNNAASPATTPASSSPRAPRSRSHTPSGSSSSSPVPNIPKATGVRSKGEHRTASSPRSGSTSRHHAPPPPPPSSMPTPWSAHPLSSAQKQSKGIDERNSTNVSDLIRTSPDFHPDSPPREREPPSSNTSINHPVTSLMSPSSSDSLKPPRRLSSPKKSTTVNKSESVDLLAGSQRGQEINHTNVVNPATEDMAVRHIATRHSETSFSELEDQPFGLHVSPRSKTRKSANSFSSADLEDIESNNNHFLASNLVTSSEGMTRSIGSRHSSRSSTSSSNSSSTSSSTSTKVSHTSASHKSHSPRISHSSQPSCQNVTKTKHQQKSERSSSSRRSSPSSSRFKEEESAEEATKRRLAYKEKCELEILEFQKSLQLEENADEDTSYLNLKPRSNVVRRSDSLGR